MSERPFAALPFTAESHFRLYFYGALVQILEQVFQAFDAPEAAFEEYPFLESYFGELAENGLNQMEVGEANGWWKAALRDWEDRAGGQFFPLKALGEASGIDYAGLTLLVAVNLLEEDTRFGQLYETMQQLPGQHRPVRGLLGRWWEAQNGRKLLLDLQELGLVQVVNPEVPRPEQALQSPPLIWDAIRGQLSGQPAAWLRYRPPGQLPDPAELILPEALHEQLAGLPGLLESGQVQTVVVRGPHHNGRRTLLEAVARRLDRGILEVTPGRAGDEILRQVGPLAVLLHALPVIVLDLGGGETAELPGLKSYAGPVGIVMGQQGGLAGPLADRALTLKMAMPDHMARLAHWQQILGGQAGPELEILAERLRMTGGNIRQVARLARTYAALDGSETVGLRQVQAASNALNRQQLETLATHLPVSGDWSHLAVGPTTLAELANLESRCRFRERMQAIVGLALSGQLNAGVRALFSGPSGTGKTLAARLLAAALQMDLYRLDLASVVNKYIGETEKSLQQVFARAEELDVILLLDEGDALLTRRTNVQNSNDRYANLETNYLLQRLESYEGILLVTTNASDRIDGAFQRRMDVVVEFHLPELTERQKIWEMHLPPAHLVDPAFLAEISNRCQLSGGQIRNAVLHAVLLALNENTALFSHHLEAAVWREYRKAGQNCPLRRRSALAYQQE